MNPIEKRIAEVMESMAIQGSIIDNDAAERLVQQCYIKGLTIDDVFEGKTAKGIAERWMHRRMYSHTIQTETTADGKHYPLLPFSKVVHDDIKTCITNIVQDTDVHSSCWTFPIMLRAKADEVDAVRLEQAIERVLHHHPIFSMHIEEDGTHWYDSSYRSPYIDKEVKSRDGYVYLSLTINRILGDAASFVLLAQNIWRAYRGENLPHDDYLRYLGEYERQTRTHEYEEHAQWLENRFANPTYPLLPRQDSPEGQLSYGVITPFVIQPDYAERLNAFSQKEHISINEFYCLIVALAIMDYDETDEAGLTWAYMGRETREQMHIFGSLHRDIPMTLTKRCATKTSIEPKSLFAQLREQMQQGVLHSDYPFTLLSPKDSPWHTAVNVLVQPSIADAFDGCPANFEFVTEDLSEEKPTEQSAEPSNGQPAESYCMLDIDITLSPLTLTFNYSPRHYTAQSIQRFAALINRNALRILDE